MANPRKPAPRTQRKKEQETTPERGGEIPPSKQSVQELEKASREASRNGLPAPTRQI